MQYGEQLRCLCKSQLSRCHFSLPQRPGIFSPPFFTQRIPQHVITHTLSLTFRVQGSFTCKCNSGYTGSGATCADINECSLGMHTCGANNAGFGCVNTAGSFTCSCVAGYASTSAGGCSDVNECQGVNSCAPGLSVCTNTDGSFSCRCNLGYTGSGVACTDQDECALGFHSCTGTGVACVNSDGSFSCRCAVGYSGVAPTCIEINECEQKTHTCDTLAVCSNTRGIFSLASLFFDIFQDRTPVCANPATPAVALSAQTSMSVLLERIPVQGLAPNVSIPKAPSRVLAPRASPASLLRAPLGRAKMSMSVNPVFTIVVLSLFASTLRGHSLALVTPAFPLHPPLLAAPIPMNAPPAMAVCFLRHPSPPLLIECLLPGCTSFAACTNTAGFWESGDIRLIDSFFAGSFTCACQRGYSGSGTTCEDIDECARLFNNCHASASCFNTPGSVLGGLDTQI